MTKYYSGTGDDGTTGILGKGRISKDSVRMETIGTIDEANAALGVARATVNLDSTSEIILTVQRDLYNLMAEVAATPENADRFRVIDTDRVTWLENQIKANEIHVLPTNEFIVPGDSQAGATLDLARCIVRRAERRVTGLQLNHEINNPNLIRYLNRLSSLCFVLELLENQNAGKDTPTLAKS